MLTIKELHIEGYKKVVEGKDPSCHLHCIIAIHDTALGPALGGVRIKSYDSNTDALNDVLRLAKAMTYKSAVVQNGLGGGKSVIIAKPEEKTAKLLRAFGRVVDSLKGEYIVAEDVGSTTADMEIIRQVTPYVVALPTERSSGDPSRYTAWGVYCGLKAVSKILWGTRSLRGRTIAIQGLGSVGDKLASLLFWEGGNLILSEIDHVKRHHLALLYGAQTVSPEKFYGVECDILAPCALGGGVNDKTIPLMHCRAIAGSANNQLLQPKDGQRLMEKGILYAPDYIINAGGVINVAAELDEAGYDPKRARDRVNEIYDLLMKVFLQSQEARIPPSEVADRLAEFNLQHLVGKRTQQIEWQVPEGLKGSKS